MPAKKKRFVVVCTEKRGVFGGYTTSPEGADPLKLTDAQMCVYWDEKTHGVVGLAATGPTKDCRVTKPAPSMELRGITAVMDCTPEAANAWRACPWG